MTFSASPKGWQIWVILEQQREARCRVLLLQKSCCLLPHQPQELELGTAAATHLQWGGFSLPQTVDAATGLHHFPGHPCYLPLFLTGAICFAFPFPESSCGCQRDMQDPPFCIWSCIQSLLPWQHMKYHLTQDRVGFLFPPEHHLILP